MGRPFQLAGAWHLRDAGPAAAEAVLDLASRNASVWLSGVGSVRLREARRVAGGVAVAVQGIYSPERARPHVHREVWADPATLSTLESPIDADRVPLDLTEGAPVRRDGVPYGRVVEVRSGPQDLLLVEGPDGRRWVPWAAPYVAWDGTVVDLVDPPPGLLDDG